MMQTFDSLFEEAISLWPEKVIASKKNASKGEDVNVLDLISVHNAIEQKIFALDSNQMLLNMDWAIFTVIHIMARAQDEIYPRIIDVVMVREIFQRNLILQDADNCEE